MENSICSEVLQVADTKQASAVIGSQRWPVSYVCQTADHCRLCDVHRKFTPGVTDSSP